MLCGVGMLGRSLESLAWRRGPHCLLHFGHFGLRPALSRRAIPLACVNVRQQRLIDIWGGSEQLKEVRSIRWKDLSGCSRARMVRPVPAVQAWPSGKETCADLLPWTVKNPSFGPAYPRLIC